MEANRNAQNLQLAHEIVFNKDFQLQLPEYEKGRWDRWKFASDSQPYENEVHKNVYIQKVLRMTFDLTSPFPDKYTASCYQEGFTSLSQIASTVNFMPWFKLIVNEGWKFLQTGLGVFETVASDSELLTVENMQMLVEIDTPRKIDSEVGRRGKHVHLLSCDN